MQLLRFVTNYILKIIIYLQILNLNRLNDFKGYFAKTTLFFEFMRVSSAANSQQIGITVHACLEIETTGDYCDQNYHLQCQETYNHRNLMAGTKVICLSILILHRHFMNDSIITKYAWHNSTRKPFCSWNTTEYSFMVIVDCSLFAQSSFHPREKRCYQNIFRELAKYYETPFRLSPVIGRQPHETYSYTAFDIRAMISNHIS